MLIAMSRAILFRRHFATSWCRWGFSVIEMLGVTTMD